MESISQLHLIVVLGIGMLMSTLCQNVNDADAIVFIVTLKRPSAIHYYCQLKKGRFGNGIRSNFNNNSKSHKNFGSNTEWFHDSLLNKVLKEGSYVRLYSYHYLINGFALLATPHQAEKLSRRKEVANVVLDFSVRTTTTHTPEFLGLESSVGAWVQEGGYEFAGERIVIGIVDTGIDPTHPSFSDKLVDNPYSVPPKFSGACEITMDFPSGSCNRKLIGARHFAASAIARGVFNASQDSASPFDVGGHGTHTASVAAGNHGIPVTVSGLYFGNASGMAPHAHIAIYKALYKGFGGFAADVVAAIDQAAQDGVDIINLSITPNRHPPGIATFFNPIDMALLAAVKAGIFVVQAAGNTGPSPKSIFSFSPWIFSVGAASHDREYTNLLILGNNETISGTGLASGTDKGKMYTLVSAIHALNNATIINDDMYVGECQNPETLNSSIIQGNLLICSYSIQFVLGLATISASLQTAKNLNATGVVFYMGSFVPGFEINPMPMEMPAIIISSSADSKAFLQYYNSSLVWDEDGEKVIKFEGVGSISGGANANYRNSAPKVMFYSARGPDVEDTLLDNADIMKPNIIAPGNSIWGAWSSVGTDSVEFEGKSFALLSGTSMAAPHVTGIAALIKQKFPSFSAAAIASALSTTATLYDNTGAHIMAQRTYANLNGSQIPATSFDMGSGFVNTTAAMDPGLIFESSYEDYVSFLCGINGSPSIVLNYTHQNCEISNMSGADLNLPSITIAKLNQSRSVKRTVTNVAGNETYAIQCFAPHGVSVSVSPMNFFIGEGEKLVFTVFLNATMNVTDTSFGSIGFYGDGGHFGNIPLIVITKIYYDTSFTR